MNHRLRCNQQCRIGLTAFAALTALAALAPPSNAQVPSDLPAIKRTPLPSAVRPACSAAAGVPPAPSAARRQQARDAAARGQQAAILGDPAAALARLREARALDPTDADVAYQLARVYESAGTTDSAVSEFCRFLTLAPNAADATDARARVAALAKPTADPTIEAANAHFLAGLVAYDGGKLVEAESQFSRVLQSQPAWADAYFDRALTRLAEGDRDNAASDLELYLRVNGGAADRETVSTKLAELRRARLSVGQALGLGLIIPGAGQFYTHRPGWGTVFLLTAGGALGAAFVSQNTTTPVQQTAIDPFGNPYTFTVNQQRSSHPYLVPGLALGGGIALMGAVEAAMYANRANNEPASRVSFLVAPLRGVLAARIAF